MTPTSNNEYNPIPAIKKEEADPEFRELIARYEAELEEDTLPGSDTGPPADDEDWDETPEW